MAERRVTRGKGLLEPTLARLRAERANALIEPHQRTGRLLDIGCGSYPFFLTNTEFAEKFGVDRVVERASRASEDPALRGITLAAHDIETAERLPFQDENFDVVTMLAVFEHIRTERLTVLITDIFRVLKPGGCYIMTTPAGWTAPVLTGLKLLRLVSPEEIDEHQGSYSPASVRRIMERTPFQPAKLRTGHFELGMNVWMRAEK